MYTKKISALVPKGAYRRFPPLLLKLSWDKEKVTKNLHIFVDPGLSSNNCYSISPSTLHLEPAIIQASNKSRIISMATVRFISSALKINEGRL